MDHASLVRRRDFIAGATVLSANAAAGAVPEQRWSRVRSLLDRYTADKKFAGAAAAIAQGRSRTEFQVAGTIAYDSAVAVSPDSLFRLYSVSKPITGMAAMLLIEDGLIALDQPVAEVLPELGQMRVAIDPDASLDSRPAVRQMTMRHLLTHTSGLSNWQPVLGDTPLARAYRERGVTPGSFVRQPGETWYGTQVNGLTEMVRRVAEVPLIAEPGTAWHYSMGLDLMGAVIERASGLPLDTFMQRRLFAPLGMRSTGFRVRRRDVHRLTTLYGNAPEGPVAIDQGRSSFWLDPPKLLAGGGGLVSSARDLVRFGQMLLNEGELDGARVMTPATVRMALSNLLPPDVSYPPTGGFGAGAGVVMPGVRSDNGTEGVFSAVGACSTFFSVDPLRQRTCLFLAQYMSGRRVPMPEALRYRAEFLAAIEQDLESQRLR